MKKKRSTKSSVFCSICLFCVITLGLLTILGSCNDDDSENPPTTSESTSESTPSPESEIGPSSYEASHSYDELGRVSETTHDDSSSKKTVYYEYDSAGNLKKITVTD